MTGVLAMLLTAVEEVAALAKRARRTWGREGQQHAQTSQMVEP